MMYTDHDACDHIKRRIQSEFGSDATITHFEEYKFGWAFYFNSKKFIETKNPADKWIGQGVVIFDKFSGGIFMTTGALDPFTVIKNYQKFNQIKPGLIDYIKYFFRISFKGK